jgi:hypothetical protein
MTEHLVVGTEVRDPSLEAPAQNRQKLWLLFVGIGAIASMVGWFELGAIWISAELGNLTWELEAIASTFRHMILPTIGLGLVGIGLFKTGYGMACKAVAIIYLASAAFLTGILVIYIIDLTDSIRDATPSTGPQDTEAVVTLALAAVLILAYGWGSWYLRSRTRNIY